MKFVKRITFLLLYICVLSVSLWCKEEPAFAQELQQEPAQDEVAKPAPDRFGLPDLWGYEQTEDTYKAAFLPFYYHSEDRSGLVEHYWPLYGHKRTEPYAISEKIEGKTVERIMPGFDTHYTLWPFLRYTAYDDGATQLDMPWPFVSFYGSRDRFALRLFPLLFIDIRKQERGHVVLFPIFWHVVGQKSRATVFFPVYWDIKTPEVTFYHLWPLWGYWKAPGYHRSMLGFPLFSYTRRWDPQKAMDDQPADRQIDLFWPLIKYRSGPEISEFAFLPLFWYKKTSRATYFHLWPYSISRTHDGDEKKINIAFPLLYIHTVKSEGLTEVAIPALIPIFYYSVKDQGVLCKLFPLFKYESNKQDRSVRFTAPYIVPIFQYTSRVAFANFADHSVMGRSVSCQLWPIFAYHSSPKKFSITVNPFFTYTRTLDNYKNPAVKFFGVGGVLFYYTSDTTGYDLRILGGLFGLGRKNDDKYLRLFWFLKL